MQSGGAPGASSRLLADVAELADALASGASGRKVVSVRVGPSALLGFKGLDEKQQGYELADGVELATRTL